MSSRKEDLHNIGNCAENAAKIEASRIYAHLKAKGKRLEQDAFKYGTSKSGKAKKARSTGKRQARAGRDLSFNGTSKRSATVEYRNYNGATMEIRGDDLIRLTGYVNVTARDSRPIPSPQGSFIEQVTPGTFKRALSKNPNIEMRFNHNRKLCDQKSGLKLREDDIGLYADAIFKDAEVAEKARKNQLRGWSFGFSVNKDHWDESGKRYLDDISLSEVSILDKTPAYIATSVEMRTGRYFESREIL